MSNYDAKEPRGPPNDRGETQKRRRPPNSLQGKQLGRGGSREFGGRSRDPPGGGPILLYLAETKEHDGAAA